MQVTQNPVAEVYGDTSDATEMSIKMNAFTFEALSGNKLYKNLIRAIVRELSCNAYDAHVMAGNTDVAFDIHLPTTFEPFFSIRDYGIGLDDNGVRKTYLTYFDSTKRDSNTVIGAWGLGSKSPLGYTDNFIITAFKDGVSRMYTVFKKPDTGIPAVSMMCESETTEPNGVHIQMPVIKVNDYSVFEREARSVLRWFPVAPTTNTGIVFDKPDYIIEDIIKGVHLLKHEWSAKPFAIQGMIKYPIDLPDTDCIAEEVRHLLSQNLEMHFDIGELQFSMSREELSYGESTVKAIEAKLFAIKAALVPRLQVEVDAMKTDWERAAFLGSRVSEGSGSLMYQTALDFIEGGKSPVHAALKAEKFGIEDGISVDKLSKSGIHLSAYTTRDTYRKGVRGVRLNTASVYNRQGDSGYMIHPDKQTVFVINDTKNISAGRVRLFAEANKQYKSFFVFDVPKDARPICAVTKAQVEHLLAQLGNPPVELVSSMPVVPKVARIGSGIKKGDLLRLVSERRGRSYNDGQFWKSADEISDDTKYYLEVNNNAVKEGLFFGKEADTIHGFFSTIVAAGLLPSDSVLHGVRKGAIKEVKADDTWVNFETKLAEIVASLDMDVFIKAAQYDAIDVYFKEARQVTKQLATEKGFDVITNAIASHDKKPLNGFASQLHTKLEKMKLVKSLDIDMQLVSNVEREVIKNFPIIKVLKNGSSYSYHHYKESDLEVSEYVKLVQDSRVVSSKKAAK